MAIPDDVARLAAHLHRVPIGMTAYRVLWTPNGGASGNAKRSMWIPTDAELVIPNAMRENKNVYWSVNPVHTRRADYQSTLNQHVCAVNALFAEYDGKDFISVDEWLPFYVEPELSGLSKARQRGALQKAQTTAIKEAYKANPTEYKRRAFDHVAGLPLRPSYLVDSGGGYQGYWPLRDTVAVDDSNRDVIAHYQRAFVHYVGGDKAAVDLRRILRVPGTHNVKPTYAPDYPEVTLVWANHSPVYTFDDLIAHLPPPDQPVKREQRKVYIPSGVPVELADLGAVPALNLGHRAITRYNRETDLRALLVEYGYTDHGNGRMSRPGADTQGVELHDDNTASIYSSSDPLFCDHRITPAHAYCVYQFAGDINAMLAELDPTDLLNRLRFAIHSVDFSNRVPSALQAANGYRTHETDLVMADAALSIFMERYTLQTRVSALELSVRTGRSDKTCKAAMKRLAWMFAPVGTPESKGAQAYRVLVGCVDSDMLTSPCKAISESTQLPIATHSAHDAFTASMTPMSQGELNERLLVREEKRLDAIWRNKHEMATGVPRELIEVPKPLDTKRYKKRLAADKPSAGPAVLRAVNAIEMHGSMNRKVLAAHLHKKKHSVSRLLQRGLSLGIFKVDGDSIVVVDGWRKIVDDLAPSMPTAGTVHRRKIAAADSRIRYCDAALRNGNLTDVERKSLVRRLERAAKAKLDIAKSEAAILLAETVKMPSSIPGERDAEAPTVLKGIEMLPLKIGTRVARTIAIPPEDPFNHVRRRQLVERHAQARMDVAESARADQWRLISEIQRLRIENTPKRDAWRMLELAGWARNEVQAAMLTAWPATDAPVEVTP